MEVTINIYGNVHVCGGCDDCGDCFEGGYEDDGGAIQSEDYPELEGAEAELIPEEIEIVVKAAIEAFLLHLREAGSKGV